MAAITFDTHRFIQTLRSAGVEEKQAEAFSIAFRDAQGEAELATKGDMRDVKAEMRELKAEISEVKTEVAALRNEMSAKFDSIRWVLLIIVIAVLAPIIKEFF
ncbi:MAG: CCDC90 family protein [Gammaproteobacteria bacterium]|nr:CCDC90 family protein [Gammaproteobacteria bacterium]NNJ85092.1 hypothetical protein [Gammaproteobacteria bacterium]